MQMPFAAREPGLWIHPTAELADLRCLEKPVLIGPDVTIGNNVRLGPFTIIGRGRHIEDNCDISHSILWQQYGPDSEYPSGSRFGVVSRGTVIRKAIIAGMLPLSCRTFKTLWGDDASGLSQKRMPIVVPLDITRGSEIDILKQNSHILIIDDSARFLSKIRDTLEGNHWAWISMAKSAQEALEKLKSTKYALIILDSTLSQDHNGPTEGVELLTQYKMLASAVNVDTPVLLWSSQKDLLQGIDPNIVHLLPEAGVTIRSKKDPKVKFGRLSAFILDLLQKTHR
jgi:CheY-like chemotaxis protein